MFKTEEIDSWNETFVNGKIQEADLKHPTEGFLVRTLIAYLQMFGYKVEQPCATESRERRLFLVQLAQNIDRVLKYTDKSYAFFYYDLVKPVPKKTSHTLGILLNYYYYYNMFKNSVFTTANERLKEHEELLQKIQATKRENQERKERAEQIGDEIASFSKTVPSVKAELNAWKTKKAKKKEQLQKEHDELEDLNKQLDDLRTQELNLRKQIVENDEAVKLKSELTDLQSNVKEYLSTKENLETVLNDRMEVIKNLENLLKRLGEARNIFSLELLAEHKDLTKKLKQSRQQYDNVFRKKISLLDLIEKQDNELKSMEEKFNKEKQQFEQKKAKSMASIKEIQAACESKQQKLQDLKILLKRCNDKLEEQRQDHAFLENAIHGIMSRSKTL